MFLSVANFQGRSRLPLIEDPATIDLLQVLIFFLSGFHFSAAGLLLGGTAVSLALRHLGGTPARTQWAVALLDRISPGRVFPFLVGLIAVLAFAGFHLLQPTPLYDTRFWSLLFALLFVGLGLLLPYRALVKSRVRPSAWETVLGLAAIFCLGLAYFLLFSTIGLLVRPEKWLHLSLVPELLFSWHGTARFLEFILLSLALAGSVLLGGRYKEMNPPRRGGATLAFLCLILLPIVSLFHLHTLPDLALSVDVFLVSALAMAAAGGVCLLLIAFFKSSVGGAGGTVLFSLLGILLLWLGGDFLERGNAMAPEAIAMGIPALPKATEAGEPEKSPEKEADPGAAVFDRVCKACHRFDRKVVGPPLNDVLPKYRGKAEALKSFIANPVKVDPEYPSMPDLNLSPEEISAVVDYLLEMSGEGR